ncbi:PepSY domain-containing protein [Taibaiella lutea]|uniref:PepSY domain-containing protein n=1 Tax=Taibaiella lutea TaxID=2608001 RepID=A0A5M6CAU0_9BACT|nr:PepSY-associated TM helix domain-containing protein [Taibaiella lutea]KAA5532288.1 PepSY domain-containing protein [Taibaiella lutea]
MSQKKTNNRTFKKLTGKLHLILGLASGIIVCILGITGCMLAFQREIEDATQSYRFTAVQPASYYPPSQIQAIAVKTLPGKKLHSISYQQGKSAVASFYNGDPSYYYLVYLDPYTGKVLKVKDMSRDFFRIVIGIHYYLLLPENIGQPIVASATLIFVILLISGIILWWPRNKAARKQRFSVKWKASRKRTNYDLHNVLGFYMSWIIIFIALSGLVMGFQWFSKTVYWVSSGGKAEIKFSMPQSAKPYTAVNASEPLIDKVWKLTNQKQPGFPGIIEVHIPEDSIAALEIAMNPDGNTYWKSDYIYYDQNTLKEIPVKHAYGLKKDASAAQKLQRMNYDIHVGAVLGLPGKIMAFCASLICASMPVTGFMIWRGRKKKKKIHPTK